MNRILFMSNFMLLILLIVANFQEPPVVVVNNSSDVPWDTQSRSGGLQAAQIAPGLQVNSLPHPFNLNGSMPYQVWVDGERLPLKGETTDKIIELLDLGEFQQPKDTAEIHQGAGWLTPLPITQ